MNTASIVKTDLISENDLYASLEELHTILQSIGNSIVFFDIKSFYAHIGHYMNEADTRKVTRLINTVEPFIPIVVSDESIDTFLEAAMRNDINEVERLETQFISSSKIKFIRSLAAEKCDDTWRHTVDTCQTIRKYKTEGIKFGSN